MAVVKEVMRYITEYSRKQGWEGGKGGGEPKSYDSKKACYSSSYLFHGADHLPIHIPGGSVVDP